MPGIEPSPPPAPRQPPSGADVPALLASFLAGRKPTTRLAYEGDLSDFRRFARTKSIDEALARLLTAGSAAAGDLATRYRRQMTGRRGLSSSTVNRRLTCLRQITKMARKRGLIAWDLDVENLASEPAKDNSGPETSQVRRILEQLRDRTDPAGRRDFAIIRLCAELGLRRKEVVGLDLKDIDHDKTRLQVLGKGRREKQWLEFSDSTGAAIRRWMEVRPETPCPAVFTNLIPGRTARLTGAAVYQLVRHAGTGAKLKVRPHGLRHTAITEAVRNAAAVGLSLDQVAEFSRHKDLRMVMRYRDKEAGAQRKLAGAVGRALGG